LRRPVAGAAFTLLAVLLAAVCAPAQAPTVQEPDRAANRARILLVRPFDNHTGQPTLEWIGEAAAELLSNRFRSAGFQALSRENRVYALDHLGLPQGFQPSRASALKLAMTLDADSIIVGSFSTADGDLTAEAQVIDVSHLRMSQPITESGKLSDMIAIFDSLAWKLAHNLDPNLSAAESTFIAAGKSLRVDGFEQYIRGITEPDHTESIRHLNLAVKLMPGYSPAWMALGREEYNSQDYGKAALAFAKVDTNGPDGLEAGFYRGLSLLYSGDYSESERAFAAVARILPLAEVLNNEGVAVSRQGHDATTLFVQAAADDPDNAVYHFNLAISLKRQGKSAAALNELAECLKLHPGDTEAQSVEDAWKAPAVQPAATPISQAGSQAGNKSAAVPSGQTASGASTQPDPLARIVRTFDASAFRQAAQMLNELDAARLAKLPPRQQALALSAQAKNYLDRGLLLEAERLYQSAVAADPNLAEAHAGLAEVRERAGDAAAARQQAQAALQIAPSVEAYLVLGRLDLADGHLDQANSEAGAALRLDPGSPAAQELSRQIAAKEGQKVGALSGP
jgi:tetratricopeptide (TPR) repeat protein